MITDMFAGSNQSVNLSALISSINAGTRVSRNQNGNDEDSSKPVDFASLLSQTMDSGFSVDSQLVSLQSSSQSSVSNVSSTSFPKTSFNLDTYSSSPLMNMSERNSFQSSFDVASSRNASQKNANLKSDKNDQTVSKETQKVEKEDSDSNTAKEASEANENENVVSNEKTKVSEENEIESDVELSMAADVSEEAPVVEEVLITDNASEEISVEAADDASLLPEETVIQANEESEKTEEFVELEDTDEDEETETTEVAATADTNPEIFAQTVQNTEKVESEEEVAIVEVEAANTENKVSETKLASAKETKTEEADEDDTETKETAESDKLANAVSQQVKTKDNQEEVFASEETVETSHQEVASNLNNVKKAEVSEEKVVEENTDSETVEAVEDSDKPEKEVAKADDKSEKESKFDKIVESLKENDSVVPEESLRKEFARLTGQDKQASSENAETATMDQTVVAMEQQASTQAAATADSTADETADKIFAAITEKLDGVDGKSSKTQVMAGEAAGANKGFNMNQNNGSGMNNGFSFQSGSSQTYDASGRVAQTHSATPMNFSELLTKAEMVKTKDGAKVMNVELEQEGVGKLELELTSKDGEVTARLSAESDMAKIKLEEIAPQIKENLQEKGVNLTQISVDVSSKNADENGKEYQSFGRKNKSDRIGRVGNRSASEIIKENILPNLRRQALNIQSVDITV